MPPFDKLMANGIGANGIGANGIGANGIRANGIRANGSSQLGHDGAAGRLAHVVGVGLVGQAPQRERLARQVVPIEAEPVSPFALSLDSRSS